MAKRKKKAEGKHGGPIVAHGPERRSRAERRAAQLNSNDRMAAIERALIAKGLLTKNEIEAQLQGYTARSL